MCRHESEGVSVVTIIVDIVNPEGAFAAEEFDHSDIQVI